MRFFIGIFLLVWTVSCSNEDNDNVVTENISINGSWKPYKYEFRGKTILLSDCERKGQILINADFSGAYDRYETDAVNGNCIKPDSFTGQWVFDKMYSILNLTYTEGGVSKTVKKEIDSFSSTELRIHDNSKNLDNVPGNDEAVLIFIKE
ncbi:lipocalin-like protein [Chryseobacterium sp. 52]|uniref:lipocalin family protein n=1 Tax=Chryseobacterium sp. 52 TaxID=2035213 RepID=UPI000C1981E0|nr:lipocalin family protein [Chryseobacterium sp. 52]PIF47433.1 lipocalin-like protein [Chryseobacterium sp. 52]